MKIAVIGGGLTGLTASYYLAKKGHQITIFEKAPFLGGLAAGFKQKNWDWSLEYAYHHLFANDYDIINFAKEIGFNKIFFSSPETASLFTTNHPPSPRLRWTSQPPTSHQQPVTSNHQIFPLDTPFDLLRFPLLSFSDKIRAGAVLAFLKLSPFLSIFEKQTSEEFLTKFMGKKAYSTLFQELFRKKFGNYAGNILASFFWARIKKRTKKLGYIKGGFQTFIDYLVKELTSYPASAKATAGNGVNVLTNYEIKEIIKKNNYFVIPMKIGIQKKFDIVISTLPSPITSKIGKKIFPADFTQNLRKIKYLGAMTLILESKKPLLEKTYWLNISTPEIPIMGIIQHTNFIDKKYYGGNHLTYFAWYLDKNDKKLKMKNEELLNYINPYLKKINPKFTNHQPLITNHFVFRAPFAQPIFDKEFLKYKPDFTTPVKNFFIANLEMTYPYDRGTNYAVKLGKQIAFKILADNLR